MKQAVCALILRNGLPIAVSRKYDLTAFGLIGGKVDEGETPEQALIRETFEETGLVITHYKKIFERFDGEFKCTTYLCVADGEIATTEAGVVKVITWEELFAGPFGEYNKQVYNTLYE